MGLGEGGRKRAAAMWYLVGLPSYKNFVEAVEAEVSRCYRSLRQVQAPLPSSDLPTPDEWRQVPDANQIREGRARQATKQERFEQAKNLLSRGFSPQEISKQCSISLRTVYRWKKREACPAHQPEREEHTERRARWEQAKALRLRGLSQKEIAGRLAVGVRTVQRWQVQEDYQAYQSRRKRRSIFDPYAAYVLSRWQQGERSVALIFQEIRDQGFSGSIQTLYRGCREHCVKIRHHSPLLLCWIGFLLKKRSGSSFAQRRPSKQMSGKTSRNSAKQVRSSQPCMPLPNPLGTSSASVRSIKPIPG
jgi:transposase